MAHTIIQILVAAISVNQLLAQSSLSQSFDEGWLFQRGPDTSSTQSTCTDKDFPIGKGLSHVNMCCVLCLSWVLCAVFIVAVVVIIVIVVFIAVAVAVVVVVVAVAVAVAVVVVATTFVLRTRPP